MPNPGNILIIQKAMGGARFANNFNYGLHLAGPWGLFLKDARQILPQLVERPRGFE